MMGGMRTTWVCCIWDSRRQNCRSCFQRRRWRLFSGTSCSPSSEQPLCHRPAVALRRTAPRAGRGYVRMGRLRWHAVIWNSFLPMCRKARETDRFNETPVLSAACLAPDHMLYCQQYLPFLDHSLFQITLLPLFYQYITTHVCQMTCLRITRVPLIFHFLVFKFVHLWCGVFECATDLCQITFIQLMFHSFTFHLYQIIRSSSNLPPRYH